MILKTETHVLSATVCQRTGEPCPALLHMANTLTRAITQARRATSDGFEIEGNTELAHCPGGCTARFHAYGSRIRVYCDVDEATETAQLDRYADVLLNPASTSLPSGWITNPPCAILEATPRTTSAVTCGPTHASA